MKNHPNDNIYSILAKLEALKPTPEETRMSLVKEIQRTVEAQGSVLEGVSAVEAKLAKQFAESQVNELTRDEYRAKTANHRNTPIIKKKIDAMKHMGYSEKQIDAVLKDMNPIFAKKQNVEEKAVSQAQQKFMGMAHAMQKGEKIPGASPELKKVARTMKPGDTHDFAATKHKGLPQHVSEKYNPVKAVKQCARDYMEMNGIRSVHDLEAEDIESIGGDCQMNYQDVCEILGCNLPDSLGPVKSYGPDEHSNIVDFEECAGCAMGECSVHGMAEGETTHTGGEKVPTKFGTLHKSKATVDTEKELSRGDVPDLDKDDEPAAPAVAKGRGRPKMDTKDRSQAKMPWGGKPPKDTYKHQKGSFVHKIAESRIVDESGETLDHVLNRFKYEVKHFEQGGDLDQDLYEALFDYYCDSGEMPYGTAKARTGDPYEWVAQNLESHLRGGGIVGGNPDEDYGMEREGIEGRMPPVDNIPGKEDLLRGKGRSYYEEEVTMENELNELARLAGLKTTDEGNAFTGKLKATAKGDKFDLDGKEYTDTSTLDEEPNEGNAFGAAVAKAKADGVQPGEKVEVGGKTYPVKESTTFDECGDSHPEGDFNINTTMSGHGDKSVTVTATGDHAAELLQMLRIAGLGSGTKAQELDQEPEVMVIDAPEEMAEEGIEVDEPSVEPVNGPKPEYKTMRQSTMNPGEGDNGEKAMHPDRPTFKNGDNALARPAMEDVLTLEAKLAAEYESIKKVS